MNLNKLNLCRVEYGTPRHGKQKEFYILPNGEFYATTCCMCGEIKHKSQMTKNKAKQYEVDSRCLECEKKRKPLRTHAPLSFDEKIVDYVRKNFCNGVEIKRGVTKNGYSRVVIKEYEKVSALSCSYCHEIKPVSDFRESHTNPTGFRGECNHCASALKENPRQFLKRKV